MFLEFLPFFVILLAASTFSKSTASIYLNNVTDQHALLSVRASIIRDPLGALSSWNHSVHFCIWKGVKCSGRQQRVTELNLSSQQLEGTLSPHIGNLTFLRTISLYTNSFHASIPNEIGRLVHLQHLELGSNYFQGDFPENLTHCVDIRSIDLYSNKLGGKLPTDFTSWPKLDEFDISTNKFTGSIPLSIGNLSTLSYLSLTLNNLSGKVPLPLYNISSIHTFSLAENQLEGILPPDLGFTLPNLKIFYAGGNKFSGSIPPSIANASNLLIFDIAYNNITGPLLINFGRLPYLEWLSIGENQLGHNQPPGDLRFLDSLVNCTRLGLLGLYSNGFKGELPNSIVNFSKRIDRLDLGDNNIYGSIPRDIGKLVNLISLGLYKSMLTGSIPESIGQLSKLGELNLYENNISGEIPVSIGNITGLLYLDLFNNTLQGSIPTTLFNISTLLVLSLGRNRLSGLIPAQISGSSSLSSAYLYKNLFTGLLPSSIGSLKQLVELDVSGNNLTGDIPTTLGTCVMLNKLFMYGNLFQGNIPPSLKGLKNLELLDLSNNYLSGNIPSFLGEFNILHNLDLSNNLLEGEVPKNGVFSNISSFSVYGNLQLCGGIQALGYPACPMTKKKQFPLRIISLLVVVPLAVLLACFALIFYRIRKFKKKHLPQTIQQDDQHPRLSYQDLLVATANFSSSNLIGEGRYGSVYRGIVESLQQVAVKVLNVEVHGANKSFVSECETLRNVRHRNLIKIVTACSSTDFEGNDFKALVFEFMTNGSLDNWLHPVPSNEGNDRNLTLLQRLNVAIDVALGLDYLHRHSHTKIIHCDIKPSNILLKPSNILLCEEFVARIGDFGLAKFFLASTSDISGPHTSSNGVRGTVGYVPPEYGMGGEISAEGDVYSYGILLLELFSGKRPTDNIILMENANNIHDYVRKALPDRVMKIADPRIKLLEHGSTNANQSNRRATTIQVCLATIFEVGILCSAETPKERIDISVALKQLHVARDLLVSHRQ